MNALSEFVNMEKISLLYFHLKGLSPTNIKAELDSTLEDSAPSFTTINYWMSEFKRGRTSCKDEYRSGRSNEVTTTEMILDMRKLCIRWVPRLLTMEQNQRRKDVPIECLAMFHSNKADFLLRFSTIDETWVHHVTPEKKEQSKQWTERGESAPKKAKTLPSAGKVMASVFWDNLN